MPDVHTIWNSSTLGEGKKLGSSPSNRYSTNILRRKVKAKKLRDSTSEELDKVINYALFLVDSLTTELERLKSQYIVMQTTASQHEASLIITAKTECGVYKQHASDMTEQSSIKKYQTQIPFSEKRNKEMLGGSVTRSSFLYSTSDKRKNVSDTENHFVGKSHAQINIPLKEKLPYTFNSPSDKKLKRNRPYAVPRTPTFLQ
ncbi:hypothetical protein GLOIN_2v1773302 [Rhizophagus irregularis DAOM 181602=DAOM 197198]|nr:hypothetical protein GLOIN_2v1773302 [Rhizophagus irregularis DAOM 181602=DAOM 197198]CAG8694990.1 22082_t:CDS:2 [Rhizophagus irregularis]